MLRSGDSVSVVRRSAEVDALLCCARVPMGPVHAERLRHLAGLDLDWSALERLAEYHGLGPLLALHLGAVCAERVPPERLEGLRRRLAQNARRNLMLTGELLAVLELLQRHRIRAVPFKGPVLAAVAYGDLGLREFGDLDILLAPADAMRAARLLAERGYRCELELSARQERSYLRREFELGLVNGRQELLELHWAAFPPYLCVPIDTEELLVRSGHTAIGGRAVPTLGGEDLLLVLCVHGAKHCWRRLEWIAGVAQLMRAWPHLDWPVLLERADRVGCRRMLLLGLKLAGVLLDAELPPVAAAAIRADWPVTHLADRLIAGLCRVDPREPSLLAGALLHLAARERPRQKLEYLLRRALLPNVAEQRAASMPGALSVLQYPLRPLRIARRLWLGAAAAH